MARILLIRQELSDKFLERAKLRNQPCARFLPKNAEDPGRSCPKCLLRSHLLTICGHELLIHKPFERGGRSILGRAGFERLHVTRVQRPYHLQQQIDEVCGHPHLLQRRTKLFVGSLHVSERRLANGVADDPGNFGIVQVPLSEQFPSLFTADLTT